MRASQASMPRLKDTIIYEERGEREDIFLCAAQICSLRTNLIKINQLGTNFMPHLDRNINQIINFN